MLSLENYINAVHIQCCNSAVGCVIVVCADTDPMLYRVQLLHAMVRYCYTSQDCFIVSFSACYTTLTHSLSHSCVLPRSFVEGVAMYSWLVTVLLLASAAYSSGGQGAVGVGWGEGRVCAWIPQNM